MNLDKRENSCKFFEEGNRKYDEGDLQSASDFYSKSIQFNPNNVDAYFNRGAVRFELNLFNDAISDFSKVIYFSPRNEIAFFKRGETYFQLKDYYSAIDDLTKVIFFNSESEDAYFKRGLAKSKIGNFQGSIDDFSKAIEINSRFVEAIYSRGLVKKKFSDNSAEDDLKEALKINPDYQDVFFEKVTNNNSNEIRYETIKGDNINNQNSENNSEMKVGNYKNNKNQKFGKFLFSLLIIVLPIFLISKYLFFKNETFVCKGNINTILGKIPATFKSEKNSFSWKLDINLTDEYGELGEYFEKKGPFIYGVQSSDGVLVEKIDKNKSSVRIYWINGTFLKNTCTLELPIAIDSIKQLPKILPFIEFFN